MRFYNFLFLLIALLIIISISACSTFNSVPTQHIVMFDGRGDLVDPTGNIRCKSKNKNELCNGKHFLMKNYHDFHDSEDDIKYYNSLINSLKNHRASYTSPPPKKILIYIHGGLNTQVSTVERAVHMHKMLEDEGYYPIFVNWQSSLISSYFDHLLYIRQGQEHVIIGPLTSPFYLLIDLGNAILRAPIVWGGQIASQLKTRASLKLDSAVEVKDRTKFLKKEYNDAQSVNSENKHPGAIAIETGEDKRQKIEKFLEGSSYLLLLPIRLLVSAPLIDSFGTSSWNNMLRRTKLLFQREDEFKNTHFDKSLGGLSQFMYRLEEEINAQPDNWEITIVGHSMGAIVLNEMVRRFPNLKYQTIIYMAAACSISDFESSIIPYLEKNSKTQFYNLTLYRIAEEGERFELDYLPYFDPFIRGSLLSWIDLFLGDPKNFTDKTLGKYANFVRAENIFPKKVRGQVHIKEFSFGNSRRGLEPQKHGEFDEYKETYNYRFWNPEFYKPSSNNLSL